MSQDPWSVWAFEKDRSISATALDFQSPTAAALTFGFSVWTNADAWLIVIYLYW